MPVPGLDPGIVAALLASPEKDVGGGDKPGHDDREIVRQPDRNWLLERGQRRSAAIIYPVRPARYCPIRFSPACASLNPTKSFGQGVAAARRRSMPPARPRCR